MSDLRVVAYHTCVEMIGKPYYILNVTRVIKAALVSHDFELYTEYHTVEDNLMFPPGGIE